MSKKQPNQLAQLIDHQSFAGSALPQTLANNMRIYKEATQEVKTLLAECLPDEILNTCWVVGLTAEQLTLSVVSLTAANHIRYLHSSYLQLLKEQSITFQQLKQIRVIVVSDNSKNHSLLQQSNLLKDSAEHCKANQNQGLSQNTKRTISQAAKHVTTDKNLKNALLRLLNE